jgi:putative alpha-1,2-mannosidase
MHGGSAVDDLLMKIVVKLTRGQVPRIFYLSSYVSMMFPDRIADGDHFRIGPK